MTPDQLKASILQYAMEGKLVPQDPDDEPVSELLVNIQQERAQLVKEKKIKKTKPLPEIMEDEIPFEIPDSWEWVRLGDITLNTIGGGTPDKSVAKYWNGNIPWMTVKDVHENDIYENSTQDYITRTGLDNSSSNLISAGNVIVVMRMGVGRAIITKIDTAINQDLRSLIIRDDETKQYLVRIYKMLSFTTSGLTVKGVKLNNLLNVLLPLPPLAEQKRIADKLDKIMPLIDEYAKSYTHLAEIDSNFNDCMKKSILQFAMEGKLVPQNPSDQPASELLAEIQQEKAKLVKEKKIKKTKPLPEINEDEIPFEIPDSWEWVRLGDIGDWGAGGTPLKSKSEYYDNGDIPWILTGDLNNSYVDTAKHFITEKALEETSVSLKPKGSVLIAMYGATIGKLGILNIEATTNQACCACQPFKVNNRFLFYYLMSSKDYFIKSGNGAAQPNISRTKIINTVFPLPPLAEQKRIVDKIDKMFEILN